MATAASGRHSRGLAALGRIALYSASRSVGLVANTLTMFRLLCVFPLAYLLHAGDHVGAFYLFLAASTTDAVDGLVARWTDSVSTFGAALDPIADKGLLAGAFLVLWWGGLVPGWFIIVLCLRDLAILASTLCLLLMTGELRVAPLAIGKVSTALQMVLVGFILFETAFAPTLLGLVEIGFPVVATVAVISLFIYAAAAWKGVAIRRLPA